MGGKPRAPAAVDLTDVDEDELAHDLERNLADGLEALAGPGFAQDGIYLAVRTPSGYHMTSTSEQVSATTLRGLSQLLSALATAEEAKTVVVEASIVPLTSVPLAGDPALDEQ